MPNDQNPPNDSQNNQQPVPNQTPPPPPTSEDIPFPVTDLPPLSDGPSPVENQVAANAPQMPGTPPPFDIPPVVTPLTKKPWSGGRIVGAVLGLLLLVGGVTAGVLLVKQNQDIREKAFNEGDSCVFNANNNPAEACSNQACSGTRYCQPNNTWGPCLDNTQDSCNPSSCESTAGNYCTNGACNAGDSETSGTCGLSAPNCCRRASSGSGGNATLCTPWSAQCSDGQTITQTASECSATQTLFNNTYPGAGEQHWKEEACASHGGLAGGNTGGGTDACRYVNNGSTVSLAGNCTGYTFRALVFTCNGHLVNGRCEDTIVQDSPNATSVSIGSAPSCGSKQADLIVTSRPNDGLCPASDPECDELPGTPRVANFITADSSTTCGGTSASASPSSNNGTLTASCNAGIAGTGIASSVRNVHLYFDSGPEDYTSNGGDGHAAAVEVSVTGGSFNYNLHTASNLLITKESGGTVNLADGAPHRVRAFAINFSNNPELTGSGLTLNLAGSTCITTGGSASPTGPQCNSVLAYDTEWNALSGSQLATKRAGDKIRFTISGTPAGEFSKARFKINSSAAVEVTTTKPGSTGVFYYEYTIPANTSQFRIQAALYHSVRSSWIPNILN